MIYKVGDDSENSESSTINVRPEDVMDEEILSQDIDSLVAAENLKLSISQHDGMFISTSSSFSQRIISLLGSHGDAVNKVVEIDRYDLVLKFEGYEDILINLDTNTFWFSGADHVYPFLHSFSDQWERYIIRVVDDELMYEGFEQTILQKIDFADRNGLMRQVQLFFDGDIRLRIENTEEVIASNVSENSLGFNHSEHPSTSYSFEIIGDESLIAVINEFPSVHGSNVKLELFSYRNESIQKVFSTSDLTFEIDDIDYENGEVTIRLPFANTAITYVLTNEERARTDEKLSELRESNVEIDAADLSSIRNGITYRPLDLEFVDTDGDGRDDEMYISAQIESIGAKTPVSLNANVVVKYEIHGEVIHFTDAALEDL